MPIEDPTDTLKKVLESARNVRLGRGVVAKTGHVALANILVWAIIAFRLSDNLIVDAALLLIGVLATGFSAWWTRTAHSFAERNPAQAMLEGAEFLEYRKLEVEAKGQPPQGNTNLIETESPQ
jgi:hypothetical protein